MTWFLLTPASILALVCLILAAAVALYLLRIPRKARATWFLAGAFASLALAFLLWLLSTCIAGPGSPVSARHLDTLSLVPSYLFSVLLIQFAYTFFRNPFAREARAVLFVSAGLALAAILGLYGVVPFYVAPLFTLLLSTWPLLVFLRKAVWLSRQEHHARGETPLPSVWASLVRPSGRAARAHRAFALLSVLLLTYGILRGLLHAGTVSQEARSFVLPLLFILYPTFLLGFITVYVNHAPEPTTFQVKLVGLTLATTLAILSLSAFVVFADLEPPALGGPLPMPERQTLRFEPTGDGGYRVTEAPFQLDETLGRRLPLDEMNRQAPAGWKGPVELGFAFPFARQKWSELYVSRIGIVVFGDPSGLINRFDTWVSRTPMILMLATAMKEVDVYFQQDAGRATFTWHFVPLAGPAEKNTAQLTLYESGAFSFSYHYLGAHITHRGVHPGGKHPPVEELALSQAVPFTLHPGTFLLEDTQLPLRRAEHERVAGLFWLVLGSALFILVVFPLSFRAILTRRLERLLQGMRRVNEGTLETEVPVTIRDEIGYLSLNFNRMTESLRTADADLRAHAEDLEARVEERTATLAAQNAELEAQRERLAQQAEQLRQLDAVKARFFANISHEFRTPLTLLLGPIQDAMRDGEPGRLHSQLPLMQRNAERLLALIGQLLDLSKLEAGGMQLHAREVDLVPLMRQLVSAFTSRAEHEGLVLVFNAEVSALRCYVDVDKLEKVMLNLLSNALKFTEQGGKVRVRLARRRSDTGSWAELSVQDTGCGIASAELPRVFDRFHQVEGGATRPHEGTGIGLALARELVELHGGTITVESVERFGTTFTVRLPLGRGHLQPGDLVEGDGLIEEDAPEALMLWDEPAAAPAGDGAEGLEEPASPGQDLAPQEGQGSDEQALQVPAQDDRSLVLLVDDNADMRAYLKSHLTQHYQLAEAADGQQGLEAAQRLKPALVLSDVMMPVMDGYALCQQIKTDPALEHIPVVLLTARADDESRLEGLGTGADAYLAKPFNAEELLVRVENLVELRGRLRAHFGGEVVVGASQVVVTSAEAAFMEQVRDVVEAHLGEASFGVDQLASEVGLSTRQLLRRVKEASGVTPAGYIRMLRMERASQLLAQRAGTVSEVAYRVGFKQPEYFSKVFRQVFGVPPSAYATDGA